MTDPRMDLMRTLLARVETMQGPSTSSDHVRCIHRMERIEVTDPGPLVLKAPWELDFGPGFFRNWCSCGGYERIIFLTGREVWRA